MYINKLYAKLEKINLSNTLCELLFILVVSTIFTFIMIKISLCSGRLSFPIVYADDIGYFVDGMRKLYVLRDSGVKELLEGLASSHSPFSTFFAMLGFAIFGMYDWSPYATNGISIFFMLMMINFILKQLPLYARFIFMVFALCIPFVQYTVNEFRPDLPTGLFTAAGVILLILYPPLTETKIKYKVIVSFCFAAALLSKPAVSFFTLGMLGLTMLLLMLGHMILREKTNLKNILIAVAIYLGLTIVLVLPYYLISFNHIINYLYDNGITHRDVWAYKDSGVIDKLSVYLTGPFGSRLLRGHIYILFLTSVIGGIWHLMVCNKNENIRLIILFTMLTVAWLIPSLLSVANDYAAATMDYLLLFSPLYILGNLIRDNKNKAIVINYGVGLLVIGFFIMKPLQFHHTYKDSSAADNKEFYNMVYSYMKNELKQTNKPIFVYQNAIGPVEMALNYRFLKDGIKADLRTLMSYYSTNLDEWKSFLVNADYAIVHEAGTGLVYESFPSAKIINETLNLVRNSPDFKEIQKMTTSTGKSSFIFKKIKVNLESVSISSYTDHKLYKLDRTECFKLGVVFKLNELSNLSCDLKSTFPSGWNGLEPWGIWSTAAAEMHIDLPKDCQGTTDCELKLLLGQAGVFNASTAKPKKVFAKINGRLVGEWSIAGAQAINIPLDSKSLQGKFENIKIQFSVPDAESPGQVNRDTRTLGIGLTAYQLIKRNAN